MARYKKILVAFDGSDSSKNAQEAAADGLFDRLAIDLEYLFETPQPTDSGH